MCYLIQESLRQQIAAQISGHTEAQKLLTEEEKKEIDSRSVHVAGVRVNLIFIVLVIPSVFIRFIGF